VNEELNVIVYDRHVGRQFDEIFAADLRHVRQVTYEEWRHRGVTARLFELLLAPIRDLL